MKKYLLKKVIDWLLGGELFANIRGIVEVVSEESISGSKKREKVKQEVKELKTTVSSFLINLGIEAAVTLLKVK